MVAITIPVHPLSRRLILSEYGDAEPVQVALHDALYIPLSVARLRERYATRTVARLLSSTVTIQVSEPLGRAICARRYSVGMALLKWHKEQVLRYAHARVVGKADAWAAIQEYLTAHGVSEDDWSMETAYKNWQRFWWAFGKKNAAFSGQKRSKSGVKSGQNAPKVSGKTHIRRRGEALPSVEDVEAAYLEALCRVQALYPRPGVRLPRHLRHYIYMACGYSCRAAAQAIGSPRQTVHDGYRALQSRMRKARALRRAIEGALADCALPAAH